MPLSQRHKNEIDGAERNEIDGVERKEISGNELAEMNQDLAVELPTIYNEPAELDSTDSEIKRVEISRKK